MYKSKVGMIGLGNWGKNIYRNLLSFKVLKKIYDIDLDNLLKISNEKIICKDINEIITSNDIDTVVISSPAVTHKELIIKSLLNNKNVFVEKPLCLSLTDALEIKKIAIKVKKIFFVGHLLHYHNAFNELKKKIHSGFIGNLKIIKANRLNFGSIRKKESVLYDLASHDVSMILSITKSMPFKVEVNAVFQNSKLIADYVNIILYFKNDLIAIINSDWISPYKEHRFSVYGSKGSLIFDDTLNWEKKLTFNPSFLNENNNVIYKTEENIPLLKEEPLTKEIKAFLNCIETSIQPKTDIEEAIKVQKVLDMIDQEIIKNYG